MKALCRNTRSAGCKFKAKIVADHRQGVFPIMQISEFVSNHLRQGRMQNAMELLRRRRTKRWRRAFVPIVERWRRLDEESGDGTPGSDASSGVERAGGTGEDGAAGASRLVRDGAGGSSSAGAVWNRVRGSRGRVLAGGRAGVSRAGVASAGSWRAVSTCSGGRSLNWRVGGGSWGAVATCWAAVGGRRRSRARIDWRSRGRRVRARGLWRAWRRVGRSGWAGVDRRVRRRARRGVRSLLAGRVDPGGGRSLATSRRAVAVSGLRARAAVDWDSRGGSRLGASGRWRGVD